MSSRWGSPPPCRWAGWAGRTRWRKPPCSSRPTTAATSLASSCSSMAVWPRYKLKSRRRGRAIARETQMMREEKLRRGDPIGPLDWRQILPFEAAAASDRLGWVGLEAARCRAEPAFERNVPAITHHRLVLVTRPPEDLDLRYEGVKRHRPTPAGSISGV